MEKQTSDLYYIVQNTRETIRSYFNRFNAEMINVRNCDIKTAIEAYKRGLDDTSGLYIDLTKYPPENFDDVRARTLAYMRIEDDAAFRRKHSKDKKILSVKKPEFKTKGPVRSESRRQVSNVRFDKTKYKGKSFQSPKLSTYDFAGTPKDLVESLKNIQTVVRWPKKSDLQNNSKDQSKWCNFHNDHGHMTEDCISFRKEVAYLNSKGHLKDLIKGNLTTGNDARPPSPEHTKVVNCIIGGSVVCGLTYSAVKRHARQGPDDYPIP